MITTSYKPEDVTVLLDNVKGKIPVMDTEERERNKHSGKIKDYLALEYRPTPEQLNLYEESLNGLAKYTANAVKQLGDKLYDKFNHESFTIVSLARIGTPVGILLKRYLEKRYGIKCRHYTISVDKTNGIDVYAMQNIMNDLINLNLDATNIQFVDGWTGSGAIFYTLIEKATDLMLDYPEFSVLDPELAVLSDPACVTSLYGTRQDFLIPSACLNAPISGLLSRTVQIGASMGNTLHGAVTYDGYADIDKTNEYLDKITEHLLDPSDNLFSPEKTTLDEYIKGEDDIETLSKKYCRGNRDRVRAGMGATIKAMVKRNPVKILIRKDEINKDSVGIKYLLQYCRDKGICVSEEEMEKYSVCGIF